MAENLLAEAERVISNTDMRTQFQLRTLFAATAVFAVVFAAFRWLGLAPRTSLFISAVALACFVAALALLATIAKTVRDDEQSR